MKILDTYSRGLKKILYDYSDEEVLKERFDLIPPTVIHDLCEWLRVNNETLTVDDTYDPQSGWGGEHFIIRNADLSINGYCLSGTAILDFIEGKENPKWY
jgi:hypothetical protein